MHVHNFKKDVHNFNLAFLARYQLGVLRCKHEGIPIIRSC